MQFYEITLHSVPKIIFAYSVSSDHYKNRFPSYENLFEISIIESGTIQYEYYDGSHSETPPGTLAPILKDMHCRTYTDAGVLQKHVTVGTVADYDCRRRDTDEIDAPSVFFEAVYKSGTILLPYQWDLGHRYAEIEEILKRIIYAYTSMHETHRLDALSEWFRLVSVLTEIVLNRLSGKPADFQPASVAYVRAAKQYIAEHYSEKIAVADIAAHLGISVGYLHGIFKKDTGMSVIDYLTRYRVSTFKQYVSNRGLSLKEAASQVGIDDPAYMSRLFKKTEGLSFREYCASAQNHN